jgi:protein O-GlcNAc transferase
VNKYSADELFKIAYEHLQKRNYGKSAGLFEKLLKDFPRNLSVLKNLSHCYAYIKELEKAENCIKEIINIKPNEPFAYQFLASILKDQDKIEEATLIVNQGLKKGLINEKWEVQKNLFFPKIPSDNNDIIKYRRKIEDEVEKILDVNFEKKLDYDNDQIIVPPHVDLSYSNLDNLEINKKSVQAFKKLYRILNEESYSKIEIKDKIRIGIVSEFFTDHTIGKLYKDLIFSLDKNKFETFVFHSKKTSSGEIFNEFKKKEKEGVLKNEILPIKLSEKINVIKQFKLNIIFYPEIGLSIEFYYLALMRLAKYQITTFGHPETTGSNSIDFFLISKNCVNDNTQKHYSEKLLLMNYLPMVYSKPCTKRKLTEDELAKKNIYSCPQTLFKIHPDFDQIIFDILERDKKGVVYLIKDRNKVWYKKLIKRLSKNKKYDSKKIIFMDPLSYEDYLLHLGRSSVLLDPLYYGAGNSFFESMLFGTPTITFPTDHIKSRLVLGAYKQMEIKHPPIATGIQNYIDLAVKYANRDDIKALKDNYKTAAEEKLFNTKKAGEEFNKIISNLFN